MRHLIKLVTWPDLSLGEMHHLAKWVAFLANWLSKSCVQVMLLWRSDAYSNHMILKNASKENIIYLTFAFPKAFFRQIQLGWLVDNFLWSGTSELRIFNVLFNFFHFPFRLCKVTLMNFKFDPIFSFFIFFNRKFNGVLNSAQLDFGDTGITHILENEQKCSMSIFTFSTVS